MTSSEALNRGYNLFICGALLLSGLSFGSVLIPENDLTDKIDDGGLLLVGLVSIAWYAIGRHRFARSMVPVGLVVAAMIFQALGLILERDDKEAFGDNIGGTIFFVVLIAFAIWQWVVNGRHLASLTAAPVTGSGSAP